MENDTLEFRKELNLLSYKVIGLETRELSIRIVN